MPSQGFHAKANRPRPTLKRKMPMNQAWSRANRRWSALIQLAFSGWPPRRARHRAIPTTAYAKVANTSGPPMAAPTPMSFCSGVSPNTTAMKVTALSGNAVPKAARIVPVAVAPRWKRCPTHSTPLTKNSQAK
ncbi:hypothetical protein D3C86_1443270 [compost metagenome]